MFFSRYLFSRNIYSNVRTVHNIFKAQELFFNNVHKPANLLKVFPNQINCRRIICTADKNLSQEDSKPDETMDYSMFFSLAENEEVEKQIRLILMEHEIAKQSGERMPSKIELKDMQELLGFNSELARRKYFHYLFKKEVAQLAAKRKKEERKLLQEQKKKEGPKNTFFIIIRKTSMVKFYNSRQANAVMFGSPLVFDMGYHEYMRKRELINCAEQIQMAYGSNKIHKEPFNLYFCNFGKDNPISMHIENAMPHIYKNNCLITSTELSYLDIFPKQKIVYLTPNAPNVLEKFDHDSVYVIGGFVDKAQSKPLSLAKAKREGVKVAKLPLDQYLYWGCGGKSLTINQVMDILLELKTSNDWNKALKFVPTRKLHKIDPEEQKYQLMTKKKNLRMKSLFSK